MAIPRSLGKPNDIAASSLLTLNDAKGTDISVSIAIHPDTLAEWREIMRQFEYRRELANGKVYIERRAVRDRDDEVAFFATDITVEFHHYNKITVYDPRKVV